MELGAHVWLRKEDSHWGWVPAVITEKLPVTIRGVDLINLTLRDDPDLEITMPRSTNKNYKPTTTMPKNNQSSSFRHFYQQEPFELIITVDPEQLKTADHEDVKLRNLPTSFHLAGEDREAHVIASPSTVNSSEIVGGVDDLIGLTHLHEPAILHALRLRYDADIIYTSTGPILIAVNPFKKMNIYSAENMENYCLQGEQGTNAGAASSFSTPFKNRNRRLEQESPMAAKRRLPPHVYQTADDAYRAMIRGMENVELMYGHHRQHVVPTDQSILVSGESGAGKTVTTKIVLNYFAMLSKRAAEASTGSPNRFDGVSIEQQVLQSNPILESFGNARTIRNDNSSRFGKYIDIHFTRSGKLSGALIETYLLEKVRLIHPGTGERNYHVFYQFLSSATHVERKQLHIENRTMNSFKLLSQSGTFDRRDGVSDEENHQEMLEAMAAIGFEKETIDSLMQLIVGVLFAGNMTFTASRDGESCSLDHTEDSKLCAELFGITLEGLSDALTTCAILAGDEVVHKQLTMGYAMKASEALIKAVYGAAFDFIVERVNASITDESNNPGMASIGLLDIFGFETFDINSFEQLCINYTNEALQQQFNRYVFKLEQEEYEKEGIMWKFISFPDNQDVLDLIDKKHVGIMALLDEQCILPRSTDEKFTRYIYARCDKHQRFSASSAQRVDYLFSIEHYAGFVEYNTENWLEKNKDQLPAASSDLLLSSNFKLLQDIRRFVRSEERGGRGTVATKSVSSQFSAQLRTLRARIDLTVPHYVRCLKPNDELAPDHFEPKNVVEQLRCGGVLEAVRVSRAGYPTRYPHQVFWHRYYILGDNKDDSPQSPVFEQEKTTGFHANLKRLISQVAYDLWYADHQVMRALLLADADGRDPFGSPKFRKSLGKKKTKGHKLMSGPFAPPLNLVYESSVKSPEGQRRRKTRDPTAAYRERRDGDRHGVTQPASEEEFLELDFASRCAVAGLQLGRNKVFLRREAFDRIEAMRSDKYFGSAAIIQKTYRGMVMRRKYLRMREGSIALQCAVRILLAKRKLAHTRRVASVVRIQCLWRGASARDIVNERMKEQRRQSEETARANRGHSHDIYEPSEDDIIYAVTAIQACHRGRSLRKTMVLERKQQLALETRRAKSATIASPVRFAQAVVHERQVAAPVMLNDAGLGDLFREIDNENWATVETILDKNPELAEQPDRKTGELALHKIARHNGAWTLLIDMVLVLFPKALIHRDNMGALPIHHAAAHDNLAALEIIYSAYKDGINENDKMGRLPLHVASTYDAIDSIKFLLSKSPEGAYTMVYRPPADSGGGLPLHVACSSHASIGAITALLAENFASAKRADENGDLPLHLLLRCGEAVDPVVVKTLLTCFAGALSRTDMHGDLPLSIAIKHQCRSAVINAVLMQYPEAAGTLNGEGHSPLFLAFKHNADDRTIMGLLNHAPDLSTAIDRKTGLLPIQVATENEHSHFIVHNLLKRDLPIDQREKVRAQLIPHHYSWNHVVSNTDDLYHQVITKILQTCTQPQVLALAHVEGPDGKIALASATPVCKHEMRVMLRLFNTLEVVNQRPAYTNPVSDTQIFYALRYDPPAQHNGQYTILHEEKKDGGDNDYLEEYDDQSHVSGLSRMSIRSTLSTRSQQTIEDKLRHIRKEKGQQVIAKLTSRSDVVERELKVRKDYHLSRHYVPAIISVHHTVQHAAYSEAMAEPGYCITMEGADTTAENLMLDMRKSGHQFPVKALKRIGISLLHMHEHGIIHGDFGTHNIGKFGSRWKLLGVGGSVPIGGTTDPERGFYHPPESIYIENRRMPIGQRHASGQVVSIRAEATYDIWAYGVIVYESIAGVPLGPYACRGRRAMTQAEVCKIGSWDEQALRKALKQIPPDEATYDLLAQLLHPDPEQRVQSLRTALEHPFFARSSGSTATKRESTSSTASPRSSTSSSTSSRQSRSKPSRSHRAGSTQSKTNGKSFSSYGLGGNPTQRSSATTGTRNRENVENGAAPGSPGGGDDSSVRSGRSIGESFRKLRLRRSSNRQSGSSAAYHI